MTARTITKAPKVPQVDEVQIASIKAQAKEARRLFIVCRRPSKEQRYIDRFMWCRTAMQEACGGDYDRFRSEWADIMEGR